MWPKIVGILMMLALPAVALGGAYYVRHTPEPGCERLYASADPVLMSPRLKASIKYHGYISIYDCHRLIRSQEID